jgi:hypothetical protein
MTLFTVLGCVTDIDGALPYMADPATDKNQAVENWYIAACENLGVNPESFPPESADHESLIDTAHSLRKYAYAFLDGEALILLSFNIKDIF